MRSLLLAAIIFYQRHLSPHKGFCCAWRQYTGHASCSALGFRAVRRYGVSKGLGVLRRRLFLCGVAHRRYGRPPPLAPRPALLGGSQRGDCDPGCDFSCDPGCDLPRGRWCGTATDMASFCDCNGCDWPDRKRHNQDDERYVYIPPNVGGRRPGV